MAIEIPGHEDAKAAAARLKVTVQHVYDLNSSRDDFPKAVYVGCTPLWPVDRLPRSKSFAKRRARPEHGIARLRDLGALRRRHRHGDTINDTTRAVAVLHNLKIDYA